MKTEKPKLKKTSANKTLARAEKNKPAQPAFSPEELAASPWGKLVNFLNDSYREFLPKSQKDKQRQEAIAPIHHKCVRVVKKGDSWKEILNRKFDSSEYEAAENFCFHLSRKYSESPQTVRQQLQANLSQFVELAEYAFADSENRDLTKMSEFCEVIEYFKNSQERTFLFLAELPSVVDRKVGVLLNSSPGYKTLLKWGASRFLGDLGLKLQREFKITRTALKDEAAQNLARELGETEANLKQEVERLELENENLKKELEEVRSQALHAAVCQLATTLQKQPQPVLDQIILLYQRLNKMSESNSDLSLSSSESLSMLIALENLLQALKSLNVTPYPAEYDLVFELQSGQLSVYEYIEGSAFANSEDKKVVRCTHPGWRVGEEVITPARVKEVTE
jgi:molecular chaperone GrpE (heat shock protein)